MGTWPYMSIGKVIPKQTGEDCMGKVVMEALSLIAEVHIVLFTVVWEIILATYRLFVPPPEKPINGEIVLITGAGHGLGRELAFLYASHNAIVVCLDLNQANNEETVATIAKLGYGTAHAYTCDVSDFAKVQEIVAQVTKEVGEVTILINNAGIMPTRSLTDCTEDDAKKIFNINVLGYIWTLKAVLPTMLKNNYGHVVAISSLCGVDGMVNLVPYCSSKFAVRGLIEALRKELDFYNSSQIKTTVIYPYIIDTGLAKKPKIRFPSLFPILKPAEVAKHVMQCQRTDVFHSLVPGYYKFIYNIIKILPYKAQKVLNEFTHIYVETE